MRVWCPFRRSSLVLTVSVALAAAGDAPYCPHWKIQSVSPRSLATLALWE